MIPPDLPELPASLKNIKQYLKVADSHDQRDIVISYWCRLYALQTGLKLSTKTAQETNVLLKLMDWLEATKKELRDNESITNDVAAQAYLENWALKLFRFADENDRAANFGKNTIQSFYVASLLYDVLTLFGELGEEAAQNRKYSKWRTTYIHNCLKNGETPVPGPADNSTLEDPVDSENEETGMGAANNDKPSGNESSETGGGLSDLNRDSGNSNVQSFDAGGGGTPTIGNIGQRISSETKDDYRPVTSVEGVELSLEQMNKAQKFIKWAGSALNYDDVNTAVLNLRKALTLLTTGQEMD